jgi:hypothetical protein
MESDLKWFIVAMVAVVSTVGVISFSISYYKSEVNKSAIQAGLVQDTLPGETGVFWVKPRE